MSNEEDILWWPDDDWCYREELGLMSHKSDDYHVIRQGTTEWFDFISNVQ